MGCFSYSCSISGLPIVSSDSVVFLALAKASSGHDQGIGVTHAWEPATVPIVGRYNDYGSVEELEESTATRAFFDSLARRAVERSVGENSCHDVAICPSSMTREEWLTALWEERVQIHPPAMGVTPLVQTMVRREVWTFLVEKIAHRVEKLDPIGLRHSMRIYTSLDCTDLDNAELSHQLFELSCIQCALSQLGRPWTRGTCCGPQFPSWRFQQDFLKLLTQTVNASIEEIEEDSGEPYEDYP
jgi:hypothetical protein